MNYYDSAEDAVITRKRALQELHAHGATPSSIDDFYAEMGYRDAYCAQAVLRWLGY